MTSKISPDVVHESETQRQYVRVRLPAVLRVRLEDGSIRKHTVRDLSVGGIAFQPEGHDYASGERLQGSVSVSLEGIGITIPVKMIVLREEDGHCCAEFDDLDRTAIVSLRQLITAYVSGEVVDAGDVLHTMNRDNFTNPRKAKSARGEPRSQFRAWLGTAASFAIGVIALGYVASELYGLAFVTSSSVATVEGASFPVTMPREGTFRSLVEEGSRVEKGAPLGTFETPMLEIVRSEAMAANLSTQRLNDLLEDTIKGTVTSPCNCRVQRMLVGNGQFVGKGQEVFQLVDMEREPLIIARFGYKRLNELKPGREVRVAVAGTDGSIPGEIVRIGHGNADVSGSVLEVVIKPKRALPVDFINRPAEVSMMTPSFMPRLGDFSTDAIPSAVASEAESDV
ncbi:PilZ domain-containing protein [uncultured Abyssibacter sp.]|uniref:HlyD family efflux transporter periplasmic adaptor subunit n=1 Tax=uncultured Abyssibacter sp. TaxID=2320202 RepID=UPI0032B27770